MTDMKATSPYLNRPTLSMIERMAADARIDGLTVTTLDNGISISGVYVDTFTKLAAILDIHNGANIEERRQACPELRSETQVHKEHSEAVKRRARLNSAWSDWAKS